MVRCFNIIYTGDTSKFAIVITQYRNRTVEVFYAECFEKPQMNEIVNRVTQLKQRHHITKIYVDGANPNQSHYPNLNHAEPSSAFEKPVQLLLLQLEFW